MNEIQIRPAPTIQTSDLVAEFLKQYHNRTLQSYRDCLKAFARWMDLSPAEAGQKLLGGGAQQGNWLTLKFKEYLVGRGLAPATVNLHLYALKSLSNYAQMLGLVEWGIKIKGKKPEKRRNTSGPSLVEVRLLLAEAAKSGPRDEAIIWLAVAMALRRDEIATLRFQDVNLWAGSLAVLQKGKTERAELKAPKQALLCLGHQMESKAVSVDPSSPLFGLTANGIYQLVRRLSLRSIGRPVWPHALRHSAGTIMNESNGLYEAQMLLRHTHSSTTDAYLDPQSGHYASLSQQLADRLTI